ncbi:MAG TPA: TetR family transcriptional regulator C-terminal domain-containing protein [Thermodesulfobacteriota bacterium]|nr:TetR family transcriptional regulator C-terminal domain-containing protein [Thermodesulfobacteriota bacterium]
MMEKGVKQRILEKGAEIIHQKGYYHTGIQEVLDAANVPKGSFYNYFNNKEDFGLQVIDCYVGQFDGMAGQILDNQSLPPLERVRKLLDNFIDLFRSKQYTLGCPIGNLGQEMGDLSESFQKKLKWALDAMAGRYIRVLSEAQSRGDLPQGLDVRQTAFFLIASWHGALIRMKIERSPEPLEDHKNFFFNRIFKK